MDIWLQKASVFSARVAIGPSVGCQGTSEAFSLRSTLITRGNSRSVRAPVGPTAVVESRGVYWFHHGRKTLEGNRVDV